MKYLSTLSILFLCSMLLSMQATANSSQAIAKAVASDVRSAEEKARDASRKPAETLAFFGLEKDMAVTELFPGGGWYTKILGTVLRDKGELTVAIGAQRLGNKPEEWGYDHIKRAGDKLKMKPTKQRGVFNLEGTDLGVKNQDMILTFRNAHNLTDAGRATLNKLVFDSLKPGGVYGVIDHTRRHMEPDTAKLWRRLDPVKVIKEAMDAGFEFVGYSDLHRQPADMLTLDSTDKSLNRNSDRFTLKFRKPTN